MPPWSLRSAALGLAAYAPLTALAYALTLTAQGWIRTVASGFALLFISSPGMLPASLFFGFTLNGAGAVALSWIFSGLFWTGLAGFLKPRARASG